MEEKEQKKPRGFGKLKVLLLVGVLVYVVITFVNQQSTLSLQFQRQEELAAREAELQRELEFKQSELDFIGTDEYVEQEVRKRLGWLRPDEIKYVEDQNDVPSASATPAPTPAPAPTPTATPTEEQAQSSAPAE